MNNQLILTAPAVAIPESRQKAFTLLQMLSTGQPVEKGHICSTLGEAMRSPLQQLESSRFHWWNIKRIYIDEVAYLQLDQRHISQNWELDKLARLERRRELAGESYAQAAKEAMRKKSAERELLESEFEYRTFLCELDSRNGEKIKCRQCGVTQPLDDYFHSGCLECGYIDMESAQQN